LQAVLRRHLATAGAVELACKEQKGKTHRQMVSALVSAYLEAKLSNAKTSVALYSVSSDVDGVTIAQDMGSRLNKAIARMLASSCESLITGPELVASMLQGAMVGVIRSLLESGNLQQSLENVRRELTTLGCGYLSASGAFAKDAAV